jgi:hypothetical protein
MIQKKNEEKRRKTMWMKRETERWRMVDGASTSERVSDNDKKGKKFI